MCVDLGDAKLQRSTSDRLGTRGRVVLLGFFVAAGYFLWTEHRAHVIAFLPWAILALCPLMHLFMHRGHGSHAPGDAHQREERPR